MGNLTTNVALGFVGIQEPFSLSLTVNYETPNICYNTKGSRTASFCMNLPKIYTNILQKVRYFYNQLQLKKLEKTTGRPLAIKLEELLTLALIKQKSGIETKKGLCETYEPKCSYKTLVVNLNRFALLALTVLQAIMDWNQKHAHIIKHTNSTDIPVCLNKNATRHKTMYGLAEWGHSGKGFYHGLKLIITTDVNQKLLAFKIIKANTNGKVRFFDKASTNYNRRFYRGVAPY